MKKPMPIFPSSFRRILVAMDFSAPCRRALALAGPLLARGGRVMLLHVVPPVMSPVSSGFDSVTLVYDGGLTRRALASARRRLKQLAGPLKAGSAVLESAATAESIARQAKKFQANLVLMSTHGRSGVSRLIHGSVAQKLLARYRGPVLMLRPELPGRRS